MKQQPKVFNDLLQDGEKCVFAIQCFDCSGGAVLLTDIKDSGHWTCGKCGTTHKVTVYKNGKLGVSRIGGKKR